MMANLTFWRVIFAALLLAQTARAERPALALEPSPHPPLDFGSAMVPDLETRSENRTSIRTVQLLGQAMEHASTCVRTQLLRDLGTCRRPEASPYLKEALADPDPMVRAEAARSMSAIDDATLALSLKRAENDSDSSVRREAILAAAQTGDRYAIVAGLTDSDPAVVAAAVSSIITKEEATSAAALLSKWPEDLRVLALEQMARVQLNQCPDAVTDFLAGDVAERCAALRVIGHTKAGQYAAAVVERLQDPHPTVRRYAVQALTGLVLPEQLHHFALAMLQDPDLTVRQAAARVLMLSPTPQAVAPLLAQLDQPYEPLHRMVRDALAACGPSAVPAVAAMLDQASGSRREDGSYILGKMRSDAALARHIELLADRDWRVAAQAAQSLGCIGKARAGQALGAMIDRIPRLAKEVKPEQLDLAYRATSEAIIAAGKVGYAPALGPIKQLMQDHAYPRQLRAASIYACGLLAGPSDTDAAQQMLSIYADLEEASDVKFEALKALGHMRNPSVAANVEAIAVRESNPKLRWIAHWAVDRINGTVTPYVPPALAFRAEDIVSIANFKGTDEPPSLSAVLQLSPFYPAGRWVPVRLELRNAGQHRIDGRVSLPIINGSGGVTIEAPILVPAHSRVTSTAYAYFPEPVSHKKQAATAATAEWIETDGKRLARTDILGQCTSTIPSGTDVASGPGDSLLLSVQEAPQAPPEIGQAPDDAAAFAKLLTRAAGFNIQAARFYSAAALPEHRAGYDGARFVHIVSTDLESLDLAQRQALLDEVRCGGQLIVTVPDAPNSNPAQTWLAPWFPVQVIGRRELNKLTLSESVGTSKGNSIVTFPHAMPICEAVERHSPACEVLLRDQNLVHAAIDHLGLGRVVFISFPINGLDPNDPSTIEIWRQLLQLEPSLADWCTNDLNQKQEPLMQNMIGSSAAPWSTAVGVCVVYLLVVVVSHFLAGTVWRPSIFAALSGAALAAAIAFAVFGQLREARQKPVAARLVTMDLGRFGGGLEQQVTAYVGRDDPNLTLRCLPTEGWVRPALTTERRPPSVQMLPFIAIRASSYRETIKSLWRAAAPLSTANCVVAEAAFGPDGLRLKIDNRLSGPIRSPFLIWGDAHTLAEIPAGRSDARPMQRLPAGDFTPAGAITTEVDRLRGKILAAAMNSSQMQIALRRREESAPLIAGWPDDAVVQQLLQADVSPAAMRTQALLRFPVSITPSPVGSNVLIDGAFNLLKFGANNEPPYDPAKREWITSNQDGQWLIGFRPPSGVGLLRPWHASLRAVITAPRQTITLRRGQCRGGLVTENANGAVVASWSKRISPQSAEFDCQPGDFDEHGCVWLLLSVNSSGRGADQIMSPWHFDRLELTYQAQVVAPRSIQPVAALDAEGAFHGSP